MAKFKLTVPIDGSGIQGIDKGHPLKVAAIDAKGNVVSQVVRLDGGKATATLSFDAPPQGLRVLVGPQDASDAEIDKLQTLSVTVPAAALTKPELTIAPIRITPFYWDWWGRWCRTYTVHGRVLCPDGSPVPGAEVCAFDVDWFLWWRSTQQVGCTMTDANGNFSMTFRWCCGWWPWWWWRLRNWELDTDIYGRILGALKPEQRFKPIPLPDPAPDLRFIAPLLANAPAVPVKANASIAGVPPINLARSAAAAPAVAGFDFARADALREQLVNVIPKVPGLESLRLWPWYPWAPWFDCAPDLIFKVTQDCTAQGTVIVDEQPWQTRWDIPTNLAVNLVANDKACCVAPTPCHGTDCLILTQACSVLAEHIGGNIGAAAGPNGFAFPGTSGAGGDRPFAGNIDVYGTVDCMDTVDYYEFEVAQFNETSSTWGSFAAISLPQDGAFARTYLDFSVFPFTWHGASFGPTPVDGRSVYETRQHYEHATGGAAAWVSRIWVGFSRDQLFTWVTSSAVLSDGLYKLRVHGYTIDGAGHLHDKVLNICNGSTESELLLRIDNRLDPDPAHVATHPCGGSSVHHCVTEPETEIVAVTIIRPVGPPEPVLSCGQYTLHHGDHVEIRFVAHDPNGHLGDYALRAFYDTNLVSPILAHGTVVVDPLGAGGIPPADSVGSAGHDYVANAAASWTGGAMKITVDDSAFPETCCYTLELTSHKRTIADCFGGFAHYNVSQSSFTLTRA